jgi:hypothetical protein
MEMLEKEITIRRTGAFESGPLTISIKWKYDGKLYGDFMYTEPDRDGKFAHKPVFDVMKDLEDMCDIVNKQLEREKENGNTEGVEESY